MRLDVTAADGKQRVSVLDAYDVRDRDGEAKTAMFLVEPQNVAGVAYLTYIHPDAADEHWVFIPPTRRARMIRGGMPFATPDLTLADLTLLDVLQRGGAIAASASESGTTYLEGVEVSKVEIVHLARGLAYGSVTVWFGVADGIIRRVDFFDADGALVKTFSQEDVRPIGGVPVAHHGEVRTVPSGSRTVIDLSDVRLDRGLPRELFSLESLARGGR
jgi:hypothetical protein